MATSMAVMTGTQYLEKKQFLDNFWEDWRKVLGPKHIIRDLKKCDFTPIYVWHMAERERKKALPKEVRCLVYHQWLMPTNADKSTEIESAGHEGNA